MTVLAATTLPANSSSLAAAIHPGPCFGFVLMTDSSNTRARLNVSNRHLPGFKFGLREAREIPLRIDSCSSPGHRLISRALCSLIKTDLEHFIPRSSDVGKIRHRTIRIVISIWLRPIRSYTRFELSRIPSSRDDTVRHGVESLAQVLLRPAVLARQVPHLRNVGPVFVADRSKSSLEVGELLLDLRVISFVVFSLVLLARFPRTDRTVSGR